MPANASGSSGPSPTGRMVVSRTIAAVGASGSSRPSRTCEVRTGSPPSSLTRRPCSIRQSWRRLGCHAAPIRRASTGLDSMDVVVRDRIRGDHREKAGEQGRASGSSNTSMTGSQDLRRVALASGSPDFGEPPDLGFDRPVGGRRRIGTTSARGLEQVAADPVLQDLVPLEGVEGLVDASRERDVPPRSSPRPKGNRDPPSRARGEEGRVECRRDRHDQAGEREMEIRGRVRRLPRWTGSPWRASARESGPPCRIPRPRTHPTMTRDRTAVRLGRRGREGDECRKVRGTPARKCRVTGDPRRATSRSRRPARAEWQCAPDRPRVPRSSAEGRRWPDSAAIAFTVSRRIA